MAKLYRAVNEVSVVGFEVDSNDVVIRAAPLIKKILGLQLEDAVEMLNNRGWIVTLVEELL